MALSDRVRVKTLAKERALVYTWEQIYRHQLRYEPRNFAEKFDLTDDDVQEIEDHYQGVDYPARLVVVNLPPDVDQVAAKKIAVRCSSKCYMTESVVTFELGDSGDHPHYNFLFISGVEWLAKSRLITEFSNSFKVKPNFVHVTALTLDDYRENLADYITKERIWTLDKRSKKPQKTQKVKLNFVD